MADTRRCGACGAENQPGAAACLSCGQPLAPPAAAAPVPPPAAAVPAAAAGPFRAAGPAGLPACPQCGRPADPGARFCRQCGQALPVGPAMGPRPLPPLPTKAGPSTGKTVALICCLGLAAFLAIPIGAAIVIPVLVRAQRTGKEEAAQAVLKSLRAAEETHKARQQTPRSYADLDALEEEGASPVGQDGVEPTSKYTFHAEAGKDAYTIIATPPYTNMDTYTLVETGDIRK